MPRSTIYAVLRRRGLSRLRDLDRPTGIPIRYERDCPGELVHVDIKKLAKVPDKGGWRAHGLHHYNHRRPHSALGDQPPITRVVNHLCGKDSLKRPGFAGECDGYPVWWSRGAGAPCFLGRHQEVSNMAVVDHWVAEGPVSGSCGHKHYEARTAYRCGMGWNPGPTAWDRVVIHHVHPSKRLPSETPPYPARVSVHCDC